MIIIALLHYFEPFIEHNRRTSWNKKTRTETEFFFVFKKVVNKKVFCVKTSFVEYTYRAKKANQNVYTQISQPIAQDQINLMVRLIS